MMDNIEKALYGESHATLPRVVAEECQQWKMRFPHIRVVGNAMEINCVEVPKNSQSYQENELSLADGNHMHPCDEDKDDNLEEDKEEIYACHGTVEYKPLLSHEFQQTHEPVINNETKLIQEALVDELTKHVWKEVVEPRIKSFMEKFTKEKEEENAHLSSYKRCLFRTCETGNPRVLEKYDKDKCTSFSDNQLQKSLSARESSHSATALSSNYEPFEFHRRHSDQVSLGHRKCKNQMAPSKISEERDELEEMVTKKSEVDQNSLDAENRMLSNTKLAEINYSQGEVLKRITLQEERYQFPSSRCLRTTEVVEELKPREKTGISNNLNMRSGRKNERIHYSEKPHPQTKTGHVRLPSIENQRWLTNNEASKPLYGRSSSALPKLAPKMLRPTMSSYKNMHGERTASVVKHQPLKHEISPVKGEIESYFNKVNRSHKYSLAQSNINRTVKVKQEKLKKELYLSP